MRHRNGSTWEKEQNSPDAMTTVPQALVVGELQAQKPHGHSECIANHRHRDSPRSDVCKLRPDRIE